MTAHAPPSRPRTAADETPAEGGAVSNEPTVVIAAVTAESARRDVMRAVTLAGVVLSLLAVVYATPLRDLFDGAGIARAAIRIESYGLLGPLLFVPICAGLVAVGVPRIFLAAVSGAAFGFVGGALLGWTATLFGCLLAFEGARALGRDFVARRLEGRSGRIRSALYLLKDHGVLGNVLIRSAPVGNCLVANLLMAVSPISRRDFLIGTSIGVLPEAAIYALFGSSARGDFAARIAAGVLLLVGLSLVYWIASRRSILARRIAATIEGQGVESQVNEEQHPEPQ